MILDARQQEINCFQTIGPSAGPSITIPGMEFGTDDKLPACRRGPVQFQAEATELTTMIRLVPAVAIVVLISMTPMAQSAPSKIASSARLIPTFPADATAVTNYYKQSVYDPSNNKIGNVVDLMVEKDGRISIAMVGVGGFLGVDEKNVAVPFDALMVSRKNNQWRLTLNTTKDALKSAPGFTYDRATVTWVSDKSVSSAERKLPLFMGTMPRE